MQWTDEAIILGVRRLGEANVVLETLTYNHGRHLGLVRGGRSSKFRSILQSGNRVKVTWRARLDEHLGSFQVEAINLRAANLLDDRASTYALGAVTTLLCLLPERERNKYLFTATELLLEALVENGVSIDWMCEYISFEVRLLRELGVHLDFETCAGTGEKDNLCYMSPKSGRAVSMGAGEPYKAKLLALPQFLTADFDADSQIATQDIRSGLKLTSYFLNRHIFEVRAQDMPFERERLIKIWDSDQS